MQRNKLAEVKPADDTEDSPAGAAKRAAKRAQRTAAAQDDSSVGLAQRAIGNHAAVDPAPDNEKAFRRLRRASRKNILASSAAEEQQVAEAAAAMTDGEAAVRANSGSSEEAQQEPAASALQIVSGPAAAAADQNKDTAAAEEAHAPVAGAERRPQRGKGQPKAAAQEAAGADNPAVKVSADAPHPCDMKRVPAVSPSQRDQEPRTARQGNSGHLSGCVCLYKTPSGCCRCILC